MEKANSRGIQARRGSSSFSWLQREASREQMQASSPSRLHTSSTAADIVCCQYFGADVVLLPRDLKRRSCLGDKSTFTLEVSQVRVSQVGLLQMVREIA